jgi:hypothetical protein
MLPEGFDIRDWGINNVMCEGAAAVKRMISDGGRIHMAKFDRRDPKNLMPREKVSLTVKGIFHKNNRKTQFQGSGTITVTK